MDKTKVNSLVNSWILKELSVLQKEYFFYFKKKEINVIATKLIKFTKEKFSNEYLELTKIAIWDTNIENTILFVYQQLLIMFHPIIPFVTDHIYQQITHNKILEAGFEVIKSEDRNNEGVWQIDCLILLINNIRELSWKSKVAEFHLELMTEWESKLDSSFDFNQFLEPLTKSKIFILKKTKKDDFDSSVNLQSFGILWYQKKSDKKELEKELEFCEEEYERSRKLLENNGFIKNASAELVEKEREKIIYYQEKKNVLKKKLFK